MQVLVHPKGHVLQPDDVGLVICWDLHSAYAISKFGNKRMAQKNWKKNPAFRSIGEDHFVLMNMNYKRWSLWIVTIIINLLNLK
jgi:hypothetical protein